MLAKERYFESSWRGTPSNYYKELALHMHAFLFPGGIQEKKSGGYQFFLRTRVVSCSNKVWMDKVSDVDFAAEMS